MNPGDTQKRHNMAEDAKQGSVAVSEEGKGGEGRQGFRRQAVATAQGPGYCPQVRPAQRREAARANYPTEGMLEAEATKGGHRDPRKPFTLTGAVSP